MEAALTDLTDELEATFDMATLKEEKQHKRLLALEEKDKTQTELLQSISARLASVEGKLGNFEERLDTIETASGCAASAQILELTIASAMTGRQLGSKLGDVGARMEMIDTRIDAIESKNAIFSTLLPALKNLDLILKKIKEGEEESVEAGKAETELKEAEE